MRPERSQWKLTPFLPIHTVMGYLTWKMVEKYHETITITLKRVISRTLRVNRDRVTRLVALVALVTPIGP